MNKIQWDGFICQSPGMLTHPGLPIGWIWIILAGILIASLWVFKRPTSFKHRFLSLHQLPWGEQIQYSLTHPKTLFFFRLVFVFFFLLILVAGLFGTPIPERNLATMLTWNLWWALVIIMIFFVGSAWCAVCPWDTLATWLVRGRFMGRSPVSNSLDLKVPKQFRNTWVALVLFCILTWLELGLGITTHPFITALLGLLMLILATSCLAIFEPKAFCRYFCPVGRTIGLYSQLAPVELRPKEQTLCDQCHSLECYNGNAHIEPCPTHRVMGHLKKNTYCTSCSNCIQSCPHKNVSWFIRSMSTETLHNTKSDVDEAFFMLVLLTLTLFHGLTMMPFWEPWMRITGLWLGDNSGNLIWTFSLILVLSILIPVAFYGLMVLITSRFNWDNFKTLFNHLAFSALPLAFVYHLAHNLNHLSRETWGLSDVMLNPLGINTLPVTEGEKHIKHLFPLIPQEILFFFQAMLMVFGFWLALLILRNRLTSSNNLSRANKILTFSPLYFFISIITLFSTWMLLQPMTMRM